MTHTIAAGIDASQNYLDVGGADDAACAGSPYVSAYAHSRE